MTWPRQRPPHPPNWKRLRAEILRRDGGICYLCGRPGSDTVDHVRARAHGGSDDPSNLRAAHRFPCHAAKTARETKKRQRVDRRPEVHPSLRRAGGG